ncbi:MAG TPA: OB-fold nucleic acid binding domain-containing protein [Candidatus Nanoarchaeia archaeon]|nr:OB-fold nucleic acid binding domain-containing protein [Candidatus Nanoarchaeia archaeon]
MIRIPFPEMIARIIEKTGLSESDLMAKIEAKRSALSGLISKEGAAHIVANELGVKILVPSGKIKDLFPGMRNADVLGRVTQIYEVREFKRADGSAGKVGSFLVGDDTGIVKIVCWGNHADILKQLAQNTPVKIIAGMVRENQRGYKEVHLNESSKVVVNPDEVVPEARSKAQRKTLKELQESDEQIEIMGTVVQVFDPKFFEVCSQCGTRLKELEGQWGCDQHGVMVPDYSYLVNVFLDDGTENIRIVLFRNQAERLLNKTKEQMLAYRAAPDTFEPLKTELLGEQFRFIGRAKKNTFFDRLEFIANQVHKAQAEEEITRLQS